MSLGQIVSDPRTEVVDRCFPKCLCHVYTLTLATIHNDVGPHRVGNLRLKTAPVSDRFRLIPEMAQDKHSHRPDDPPALPLRHEAHHMRDKDWRLIMCVASTALLAFEFQLFQCEEAREQIRNFVLSVMDGGLRFDLQHTMLVDDRVKHVMRK